MIALERRCRKRGVGVSQTSRIPTASQTKAFADTNAIIIATAGKGSFRIPGVRLWQAITRLLTAFFSARILILTDSSESTAVQI